jgi:hypothetical protein
VADLAKKNKVKLGAAPAKNTAEKAEAVTAA